MNAPSGREALIRIPERGCHSRGKPTRVFAARGARPSPYTAMIDGTGGKVLLIPGDGNSSEIMRTSDDVAAGTWPPWTGAFRAAVRLGGPDVT
jgi:hypothetical protein